MRTIFCSAVFVSITLFGSTTLTQTQPENAKRFFPSAVGNKWHWLDETGGSTFYREITRDSTAGNQYLFLFFDGRNDPSFKIDTLNNLVYQFYTATDPPVLWYNLNAQHGDSFYTSNGMYKVRVQVYPTDAFGHQTTAKEYRWYAAASNYWYSTHVLAENFGPLHFWADWSPPASTRVIGCIVDSVGYGTLSSFDDERWQLPHQVALHQNYPNPFNPRTTITFVLSTRSHVRIAALDILGREISILLDDDVSPGTHSLPFEGHGLSSGVYFYKLQVGSIVHVRKMVLMK